MLLFSICIENLCPLNYIGYIWLTGSNKTSLDWQSRLRIAVGAARGLRYLHEDCRVGCIVHRDMRPKNILLTHDFEPQVSSFSFWTFQKALMSVLLHVDTNLNSL